MVRETNNVQQKSLEATRMNAVSFGTVDKFKQISDKFGSIHLCNQLCGF